MRKPHQREKRGKKTQASALKESREANTALQGVVNVSFMRALHSVFYENIGPVPKPKFIELCNK